MAKKVEYTERDIGAEVLYALSKGLYSEPYHVIREYLQNAIDAFPNNIDMTIQNNSIYIYDDGTGMDEHGIDVCRKVGITEKDPAIHVGFRGIGIWAGLIYAKRLRISSSAEGIDKKFVLTIDFESIVKGIETRSREYLTDLLSQHVWLDETSEEEEKHYTYVELLDITENGKKLVSNDEELMRYLGATLPVDFSDDFEYRTQVNNMLKTNVPGYRTVGLKFNGTYIYKAFPKADYFYPPIGVLIIDDSSNQLGYLWACTHYGKIPDAKIPGGLVYKIKGFTIGNTETTNGSWIRVKEPGLRFWCFGEIHIIDPKVTPNTAREDLEPSAPQRNFINALDKEIKGLAAYARNISREKTAEKIIKEADEKLSVVLKPPQDIEKLSLTELYDSRKETEDVVKTLKKKKKEVGRLLSSSRTGIERKIDTHLNSYSKFSDRIDQEFKRRDKFTSKKEPEKAKPSEKEESYKEMIDKMDLDGQAKTIVNIVVNLADTIISAEETRK